VVHGARIAAPPPLTDSDRAALERLRQLGWRPRCIYDIGSSNGVWTLMASALFPLAEFHLFEPLIDREPQYREGLDYVLSRGPLRATVHPVALDAVARRSSFGISAERVGSSLLVETTSQWFPEVIEVETTSLDAYRESRGLPAAELIKVDTQGAELRILQGAERTLERVEVLVLETWLDRCYGPSTPLLHEIAAWLAPRGFLVADFCGEYRGAKDRLLAQDVVFARPSVLAGRR
jgi:FkbM family methyltransferase